MTKVLLDLKMNMLLALNICPSIIYFRERKKPPQNQHLLIYWWRGQGRLVQIYLSSWTHLGVEETDSPSTLYLFMGEARLEEGVEEERAEVWASVCAWISQWLDWEGTCSAALLQSTYYYKGSALSYYFFIITITSLVSNNILKSFTLRRRKTKWDND